MVWSKARTCISQPAPSECGNAVGKEEPATQLGCHLLQPDQAHWLGTHSTTYCLCLACSSCRASGQKLPQPLQSWICSNTLLLKEKTTTCSFQSSQLVRNNTRERGEKKPKNNTNHLAPLPFLSLTQSWEAYINCKAWESEQTPSLGNQGQPQENICIYEMCKLCNQQNIKTDKAGTFHLGSTETHSSKLCWLRLRQATLVFSPLF